MESEKKKLTSLLTEEVQDSFERNEAIIAGGAITSIFTNREINDLDVYFRSQEKALACVRDMYGKSEFDCPSFDLICTNYTDKTILFTEKGKNREDALKVQFIIFRYFTNPDDVFDSFDFTACMGAYDFRDGEFHFHKDFFKHNSQRYLKYNTNTQYPLLSVLRVNKYQEKGYSISKPEMLRVITNVMNLDISDWETAKEHIGGFYGLDADKVFDETKEFSIPELAQQLESVVPSQLSISYKNEVSFNDLKFKVFKETPRFFKVVQKTEDGKLKPRMYRHTDMEYEVGKKVNGGERGIFCWEADQAVIWQYEENKHVWIEVEPCKDAEVIYNGTECNIIGDVHVLGVFDRIPSVVTR